MRRGAVALASLALVAAAPAAPPPRPLRVDLGSGRVDGNRLLGRAVPFVVAHLGPPSSVERYPRRTDLVYGSKRDLRVEVVFAGPSAAALLFEDPRMVDVRIGTPLALAPDALQQRLLERYADVLTRGRPYRCDALGCFGTFFARSGKLRVIYGVSRGRRYVGVSLWPPR
jgi:hypothetical protein